MDDDQLLRAFVAERSEGAFRELVRRQLPLVHGVARRQAGIDAHLADDVAQRVFVALAQKAEALQGSAALVGWLYTAARLEAARVARTEARRRGREEKAGAMNADSDEAMAKTAVETAESWARLKPALDEAMASQGEAERRAVLLRFFSGQSFAEVGGALQVGEDTARKRVERAMDKLRVALRRRGIVSTASLLGTTLGAHAAPAVAEEAARAIAAGAWAQAGVKTGAGAASGAGAGASTSAAGATALATGGIGAAVGLFMSSTKGMVTVAAVALLLAGVLAVHDAGRLEAAQVDFAAVEAKGVAAVQREAAARRELAALERQRDEADARERAIIRQTPSPTRPYLRDPEYRALARQAIKARWHLQFQRFYRSQGLTAEQQARFEEIMADREEFDLDKQAARDLGHDENAIEREAGPAVRQAMTELLGQEGVAALDDFLRARAIWEFIDGVAAKTYATREPVSQEQIDRMTALVLAHDTQYPQHGTDPGQVKWNEVWEPAAQILSPRQLTTFENAVEVWSLQKRASFEKR